MSEGYEGLRDHVRRYGWRVVVLQVVFIAVVVAFFCWRASS